MEGQTENLTAGQSPTSNEESAVANQKSQIPNQKSPVPRKSTGPRTTQGKERSSRNSRKHGLFSNAGFYWDAAIALGEDPREFERLLKGLVLARQPADALEMALVEDIALLIWKKARLDRAEVAVQVRNLQKHDLERRKQFIQVGRRITNTLESEVRENGLRRTLDAPGKFEQVLSLLQGLIEMVEKNEFTYFMQESLRAVYGTDPTVRGSEIYPYYYKLSEMKPQEPGFEEIKNLMTAGLAEEIADVGREYELFLREHVENTRAARLAATAPSHAQWAAIIRQQNALHRQLERKIRLLEEMQEKRKKEERSSDNYQASLRGHPSGRPHGDGQRCGRTSPGASTSPPGPSTDRLLRTPSRPTLSPKAERVGFSHTPAGPGPNAVRPQQPVKKILNRGNELRRLLQTKGLTKTRPSKRTPFCAQKAANIAKKAAFQCQKEWTESTGRRLPAYRSSRDLPESAHALSPEGINRVAAGDALGISAPTRTDPEGVESGWKHAGPAAAVSRVTDNLHRLTVFRMIAFTVLWYGIVSCQRENACRIERAGKSSRWFTAFMQSRRPCAAARLTTCWWRKGSTIRACRRSLTPAGRAASGCVLLPARRWSGRRAAPNTRTWWRFARLEPTMMSRAFWRIPRLPCWLSWTGWKTRPIWGPSCARPWPPVATGS